MFMCIGYIFSTKIVFILFKKIVIMILFVLYLLKLIILCLIRLINTLIVLLDYFITCILSTSAYSNTKLGAMDKINTSPFLSNFH